MTDAAPLTLYCDRYSQPSRAILLLLKCGGVPFTEAAVVLRKREHLSPAFRDALPLGKVPVLREGDWTLPESCAILRYLCDTRPSLAAWYPRAPRERAVVDGALDWHHATLRRGASTLVFLRFFRNVSAPPEEDKRVREAVDTLGAALAQLESYWLRDGRRFVSGALPSIADLVLACEISQLSLLSVPPDAAALLSPRLRQWMAAVEQATQPYWADVHAAIAAAKAERARL